MAYTETALYVDSAQYANVTAWVTGAKTAGQICRQSAAPTANNERCFICTVAGTSGGSEPAWVLTRGAKTTDNTVTWMECTGLPGVNGDATNTNAWAASKGAIALGALIKNIAATHYFICTTAGTGGTGSEPSWNTTTGVTTADASVTWTCIGAISSFSTKFGSPAARLTLPLVVASAWASSSGIIVYVGDDHAETSSSASAVNYTPATPLSVVCVDHTASLPAGSGNLKTTATVTVTAAGVLTINGAAANPIYFYGIQFISTGSASTISIGVTTQCAYSFEQCVFNLNNSTANARIVIGSTVGITSIGSFKDCTFTLGAATQSIAPGMNIKMENCSFTGTAPTSGNQLFSGNNTAANLVVEGSDLSNISGGALTGLSSANGPGGYFLFKDCKIPSGITIYRGGDAGMVDNTIVELLRCDSGGTNYRNERHQLTASEVTAASGRTGGAVDDVTPVSRQVTTTTNPNNTSRIFNGMPFAIWNAVIGANRNVTVYGLVNDIRVPNNDEFWFDIEYLGDAASPKGTFKRGSKANILATGAALTADSSAWDSNAALRQNSHAYITSDTVRVASNPGRVFFCTTAGTTAGSEPGGFASAVDGTTGITDGTAAWRCGVRFYYTLTISSPQIQQHGYLFIYPRFARASMTYWIDPRVVLS